MDNLEKYEITRDPYQTFETWFQKALSLEENPHAMALATSTKEGIPTVRTVLFKGIKEQDGVKYFSFVTNYESRKGQDISENPHVALSFYWHKSERQVSLRGIATKMKQEDSKNYFHSRAKESQAASAISRQSSVVSNRDELVRKYNECLEKFADQDVIDYPENWGGYLIEVSTIEFFVYGEFRLNDRFEFSKANDSSWQIKRLSP